MEKSFNTAGLCFPEKHYMIDPLTRLEKAEPLIKEERYLTIQAPGQTGKTTCIHALARKLNAEENHIALVVSFQQAGYRGVTEDNAAEMLTNTIYQAAFDQLPEKFRPPDPKKERFPDIKDYLATWCRSLPLPVVLFIDDIDKVPDGVLNSTLRQLQDGYLSRPVNFPASVVTAGSRHIGEYNWDSLFLPNFTQEEVFQLLEQHTEEKNQVFLEEAKEEIFRLAEGQPWLTNALPHQVLANILGNDFSKPITPGLILKAKQQLILRRDAHLQKLVDKLKEDRVKRIVQAIVNGDNIAHGIQDDDIAYIKDLGLVSRSSPLKFANPIYAEIITGSMASPIQEFIPEDIQTAGFVKENNPDELDMEKIIKTFGEYYSENAEAWLNRFAFKESARHLMLMAFLQRIVNTGGEITREMAAGSGGVNLLVKFRKQRTAMASIIIRENETVPDRPGLEDGYLVIFQPADKPGEEKFYYKKI
ncbi:MAG: hypothetical protein GY950_24755 [bacterium]|nr:hypothetical protein [bacterium]